MAKRKLSWWIRLFMPRAIESLEDWAVKKIESSELSDAIKTSLITQATAAADLFLGLLSGDLKKIFKKNK